MPNFVNINGTESGYWWSGSTHGAYSIPISGSRLHNSNDVITWNFSDTMTLVYPSDFQSNKQYYVYFTSPNDGITRQYKFDVSITVPSGYLTDGLTIFSAPFAPFELTKNVGSASLHQFSPTYFFWTSSPQSYIKTWTSSNPSPAVLPNTTVRMDLSIFFSRNPPRQSDSCPFNVDVAITCLNPTPPATAKNQIIMVIDL
jgi:hypothetical protein